MNVVYVNAMKHVADWLTSQGFTRREAGQSLGVSTAAFQYWKDGRTRRESGPAVALFEAMRILEAAWGRDRMLAFVRGQEPEKWVVAMATLAAASAERREA